MRNYNHLLSLLVGLTNSLLQSFNRPWTPPSNHVCCCLLRVSPSVCDLDSREHCLASLTGQQVGNGLHRAFRVMAVTWVEYENIPYSGNLNHWKNSKVTPWISDSDASGNHYCWAAHDFFIILKNYKQYNRWHPFAPDTPFPPSPWPYPGIIILLSES